MAFKLPNGDILRNLQEQVQKNKEDIQRHFQEAKILGDFGIRVIDRMDEWQEPTGTFEYGDAIAVGPEGGPFNFYIYTRGNPDYWFDYGAISIVGPAGPEGKQGPQGETGKSTRWYQSTNQPTGPDLVAGDQWLNPLNGLVYQYSGTQWQAMGSIMGPQGVQGPTGKQGPQGIQGPQGPAGPRGYTTITNIIGSLPEGSIISDTYNPAEQPDNATVLMPVGGVQHAWVIIDGVWTDAGPYSGGSTIYENGAVVNTFNADTKLDKDTHITEYNQVYVKAANGGQGHINITKQVLGEAVPQRKTNGAIAVPATPQAGDEAASKQYVDGILGNISGHGPGGIYSRSGFSGGSFELGIYYSVWTSLTPTNTSAGPHVLLPADIMYEIDGVPTPYKATPFAEALFYLTSGTWDNGSYRMGVREAGATLKEYSVYLTYDSSTNKMTVGTITPLSSGPTVNGINVRFTYPKSWDAIN